MIVGVGDGVGVGGGYCPQYLPPVLNKLEAPVPPQIIISLPVHTAVCAARASGALVVFVAIQLSVSELYLPPVFKKVGPLTSPPQIIISLPVHTAVWVSRLSGAPVVLVAIQLSVLGLYFPPVFTVPLTEKPPHTIISLPVQTLV